MANGLNAAERALELAKKMGADKAQVQASWSEVHEFNLESNEINLYRSYLNQNLSLKHIQNQKSSTQATNQFGESQVDELVQKTKESALASPTDEAFDIAPLGDRPNGKWLESRFGVEGMDESFMINQLKNLIETARARYPHTLLEGGAIQFIQSNRALMNSNGVCLRSRGGYYQASIMFTSKKDGRASSFNYTGFELLPQGSKTALIEMGGLAELLRQSAEQITAERFKGKFVGDVVITPHCMGDMTELVLGYLRSGRMLKKQSFFEGKLGQRVASPHWNLKAQPVDGPFITRGFWTDDGYSARDEVIFSEGVLKTYLLNQYVARKLGQDISLSQGSHLSLASGKKPLNQMIAGVKQGLLLCRFSGGVPAENGDFSGVAKNSYLIENGQVTKPLSEVMVSGNLAQMIKDTVEMSAESIGFGSACFPWVHVGGLTVSS